MANVLANLLGNYGYNLIAVPKEGISPLLLLYKNKNYLSSVESPITNLFSIANAAPPVITRDITTVSIAGSASATFDSDAGISILDSLLQKLNLGKLKVNFAMNSSNKITINYLNVTEDKVDLIQLDNFISGSNPDVNQFNTFKEKLLDSELYVINSILKSNLFEVSIEDEKGKKVNAEATIKAAIDVNFDISGNKNDSITLKNEKGIPLVFAFKAQQIIYDQKKWWQFGRKEDAFFRIRDKQGVILKSAEKIKTNQLIVDSDLIKI